MEESVVKVEQFDSEEEADALGDVAIKEELEVHIESLEATSSPKQEPVDAEDADSASAVKRELDIGPTVMQPVDMQSMPLPFKPEAKEQPAGRNENNERCLAYYDEDQPGGDTTEAELDSDSDLGEEEEHVDSDYTDGAAEREAWEEEQAEKAARRSARKLVRAYPRDEDIPAEMRGHGRGSTTTEQNTTSSGIAAESGRPFNDISSENVDAVLTMLFENDRKATDFNWEPIDSFCGRREVFLPETTGPTQHFDNAYEAFRAIWTDDILERIAAETNRYAEQNADPLQPFERTNSDEILMLFAFYVMFGLVRYPTIDTRFPKGNRSFTALFTRARYLQLNSMLHFSDNLTERDGILVKISPVIEHLYQRFRALYVPKQDITIDKCFTTWKGRDGFKRCANKKSEQFGIHSSELRCSTSGYLWSLFAYTGTRGDVGDRSVGCPTVISTLLSLIRPLLHKGYTLWMDGCFNSPILVRFLKRNRTDCVGPLLGNRKYVPEHVVKVPLKKGQYIARTSQDMCVLSWEDDDRVTAVSTFHDDKVEMPSSKCRIGNTPKMFHNYNKIMRGAERKDHTFKQYLGDRRCRKWYLNMFKRLLNESVVNSRILVAESIGQRMDDVTFRDSLVTEIYNRHCGQCPAARQRRYTNLERYNVRYDLLVGHFPTIMSPSDLARSDANDKPITMTRPNKRKNWGGDRPQAESQRCLRKRCAYCYEQNKRTNNKTTFKCTVCRVPLCAAPCFQLYHTRTAGHNPN